MPVLAIAVGAQLSVQLFAAEMNYDPRVVGVPYFKHFYNPLYYFLSFAKFAFNDTMAPYLTAALRPFFISTLFAVFFVLLFGISREIVFGAKNIYGTSRFAKDSDLKKYGLARNDGVVLGQRQGAWVQAKRSSSSLSLNQIKPAKLICHAGTVNTLLLLSTGEGKNVSYIFPTLFSYKGSIVIHDPKGENWSTTAGYRSQFSHVLRFAPLSKETIRINPIQAIRSGKTAYRDANLIADILFTPATAKGGQSDTEAYFNNAAKDLLTTTILHIRFSDYPDKNFYGLLKFLTETDYKSLEESGGDDGNEEQGKAQFLSMINTKHFSIDENGKRVEENQIHEIVEHGAMRQLNRHPKERSSVFSTVFAKIQLFEDPLIAHATSTMDFDFSDFMTSDKPISLYLTIPYSDVDRIAPVFRMIITFMLKFFSDGETGYGTVKLKNHLLFILDEFPVLGPFPFLAQTMGVLRGYGINFLIVCQALSQLLDLYGPNHPFLDHCVCQVVGAPRKVEDAEKFSRSIGKETITESKISHSGKLFGTSLNNINMSDNTTGRNLVDADELMHLPGNEAMIFYAGMYPYIAKKIPYYQDKRFKWKINFPCPQTLAEVQAETAGLPSNTAKIKLLEEQMSRPVTEVPVSGMDAENDPDLWEKDDWDESQIINLVNEAEASDELELGFASILEDKAAGGYE